MKLNQINTKKGMFFIEIVFIILILFATYTAVSNSLNNKEEELKLSQNFKFDELELEEFCSQLISNPGSPNNWSSVEQTLLLGLKKNNSNELSSHKINLLGNLSDYELKRLNIEEFQIISRVLQTSAIITKTNNSLFNDSGTDFTFTRCYGTQDNGVDTIIEVRKK